MATKVRINLANARELLELPGLGTAQVAAIVRFRAEHGPTKDADRLATILSGYPLTETLRERADFSPSDSTAPRGARSLAVERGREAGARSTGAREHPSADRDDGP